MATRLGVSRWAVQELYDRWRLRGDDALVARKNRTYSFETKRDSVRRFLAGETKIALAEEYDLSSTKVLEKWVRVYRQHGEAGLRPQPHGRPPVDHTATHAAPSELERLREQNEYLRAKVAFLEKLEALMEQQRR